MSIDYATQVAEMQEFGRSLDECPTVDHVETDGVRVQVVNPSIDKAGGRDPHGLL